MFVEAGGGIGGAEKTGTAVLIVTGGAIPWHGDLKCLIGTYGVAPGVANLC